MADLMNSVVFSEEQQQFIERKIADASFSYRQWGSEDLLELRCYIRDYYRRAQIGICAYCKKEVGVQAANNCHVEHIAPKSKYERFMFEPRNLCVVCADCNEIKREQEVMLDVPDTVVRGAPRKQYPRTGNAFKIVHPHFDTYDDHIQIFESFYVDKTDKGHFTIGACRLNRRLRAFGWEAEFEEAEVAAAADNYLKTTEPAARSRALKVLKKKLVLT